MNAAPSPRLVVHIGPHKTGSTSIQQVLVDDRAALLRQGVHVPLVTSTQGLRNHLNIARQLHGDPRFDRSRADLDRFAAEIVAVDAPVAILSAEDLANFDRTGKKYDRLAEFARRIGRRLSVVGFVRDHHTSFNSFYVQQIKTFAHCESFDTFVARHECSPKASHAEVFAGFERVADDLHPLPYTADVVTAFYRFLGLERPVFTPARLQISDGPIFVAACRALFAQAQSLLAQPLVRADLKPNMIAARARKVIGPEAGFNGFDSASAAALSERMRGRDAAFLSRHDLADDLVRPDMISNEIRTEQLDREEHRRLVVALGRIMLASLDASRVRAV